MTRNTSPYPSRSPPPLPALAARLPGPQQLLQLAERAPDALGFQRRGDAADVGKVFQRAQLTAAVVQAVERDVARRVQCGGRQHERLQRRRLARLRPAVDHQVGRRGGGVEDQRVTPHLRTGGRSRRAASAMRARTHPTRCSSSSSGIGSSSGGSHSRGAFGP